MDTRTIKQRLTEFLGASANVHVLARDQLAYINFKKFPIFVVINSSKIAVKDGHWVALFIYKRWNNSKQEIVSEAWDSYGHSLQYYQIYPNTTVIKQNNKIYQAAKSNTCGLHAMHFLVSRACGTSFEDIQYEMKQSKSQNDEYMKIWYKQMVKNYGNCGYCIPGGQNSVCKDKFHAVCYPISNKKHCNYSRNKI